MPNSLEQEGQKCNDRVMTPDDANDLLLGGFYSSYFSSRNLSAGRPPTPFPFFSTPTREEQKPVVIDIGEQEEQEEEEQQEEKQRNDNGFRFCSIM